MNKSDIRRRVKARKTMLDDTERDRAARDVFSLLEQTAAFMLADRILMYHSLPDELSTHEFIRRWAPRKHFFLPRVNGVNLDILPYDESRLSLGSFHIEEPTGNDTTNINEIELIYDFQLIEEGIDTDPHDVQMDMVITETHHIVIR